MPPGAATRDAMATTSRALPAISACPPDRVDRDRALFERYLDRRDPVDRGVVRDLQQPGAERGVPAEAREAVERAQERVLADVLGVVASRDPSGDAEHDVAMALDERLEGAQVTAQGGLHVRVIALDGGAGG